MLRIKKTIISPRVGILPRVAAIESEHRHLQSKNQVKNNSMVQAFHHSLKNPLHFFNTFGQEMKKAITTYQTQNKDMNLYSYGKMMKNVLDDPSLTVMEMELHKPSVKIKGTKISVGIKNVFTKLAGYFYTTLHLRGRLRFLFLSFRDHPEEAKQWPVLPLEWIEPNGMLEETLRSIVLTPTSSNEAQQEVAALLVPGWTLLLDTYDAQLSLRCTTPANSCLYHPEKRFHPHRPRLLTKDKLIGMARECGLSDADHRTPRTRICHFLETFQPFSIALRLFLDTHRKDLLEVMQPDPRFRVLLKGGYNLRTLMEQQYNLTNQVFTSDIDLMVTNYKSTWTLQRTMNYWHRLLTRFIQKTSPEEFSLETIKIDDPLSTLRMIYQLKFMGNDFIDIGFMDNEPLRRSDINTEISNKTGLPVKTWSLALKELFQMIVWENLEEAGNPRAIQRRNPFTGTLPEKGIRDLYRARTACEIMKSLPMLVKTKDQKMIQELCRHSSFLCFDKLKEWSQERRRAFFFQLKNILSRYQ